MDLELNDEYYMAIVLRLAEKARGKTQPNPLVGSLIVKNSKIISKGYHKKAGSPHAEIEALNKAGKDLKGAVLYVNLEPCNHWGRTPPCVDRIIESGIKRVVIACKDPNPQVSGKSIVKLKKSGIKVKVGVLEKQARILNEIFFNQMKKKRPFIAVKFAQTLDGRIATSKRESKWITSLAARKCARRLRGAYDAVLVGVNTVLFDNPYLDTTGKKITKIVFDPELRIRPKANLFKTGSRVIIFTRQNLLNKKKIAQFGDKVEVIPVKCNKTGFDLNRILKTLYESCGITSVFVEGGAVTLGRFFDAGLADKTYIFMAPKLMVEDKSLTSVAGRKYRGINKLINLKKISFSKVGRDFLVSGYPEFK